MLHRRTFASAFQASALSRLTALRHPWLRWSATPAPGAWAAPHLPRGDPAFSSGGRWPPNIRVRIPTIRERCYS